MAWMAQYADGREFNRQADNAMSLPFRLTAPLWLAYGAAASLGVKWMERWAAATKLETLAKSPGIASISLAAPDVVAVEPVHAEIAPSAERAINQTASIEVEPIKAPIASEPVAPDDLTQLVGIGPKVADALAARGVTRFAQLAAWTTDDLTKFDADLKLLGRGTRDAWIDQAKRLATEG